MWYNPMMIWLLRSPLHGILSKNMLVITVNGRKSGKTYNLPVSYLRLNNTLLTTSYRHRSWWRNLRGGAPVAIRLQGHETIGYAEVIEEQERVAEIFASWLKNFPQFARYYQISLGEDDQPKPEDVQRATKDKVLILTKLEQ